MNTLLNPKLLDVVEFEDSSTGDAVRRTGTVVELFGEPPHAALIEIADSEGVPQSFVTANLGELRTVWSSEPWMAEPRQIGAREYFEKGLLLLQNGLLPRAKEQFVRALALQEGLRADLLNATTDLARRGKLEAAIQVYSLLLELQPQYQLARQDLSASYVNRGIRQARSGLLREAIDNFNSALLLSPGADSERLIRKNLSAAYTQLGVRHSEIREYSDALNFFTLAFSLSPSDVTQRNIGISSVSSLATKSEPGSPLPDSSAFRQAIQLGLTFSDCLNSYGATLASHGRVGEAKLALEAAVEVDPRNQIARTNLESLLRGGQGSAVTGLTSMEPQELQLTAA